MNNEVLESVRQNKIIVVARGLSDSDVIPFCEAPYEGGIRLVEIPFRHGKNTDLCDTPRQIELISKHFDGKLHVGAGTVLSRKNVDDAHGAGASFLLAPSFDRDIVRYTKEKCLLSFPGIMTPSEAQDAHLAGADMVKIFPTGVLGLDYIKALRVPLEHIDVIAMGGVNPTNLKEHLAVCDAVGIGGGICDKAAINEGNWKKITELCIKYTSQI